jgi:hypothetical protein
MGDAAIGLKPVLAQPFLTLRQEHNANRAKPVSDEKPDAENEHGHSDDPQNERLQRDFDGQVTVSTERWHREFPCPWAAHATIVGL